MKNIEITIDDQKIKEFFETRISRQDLALYVRRAIYIMSKNAIENEDYSVNKDWLEKGFYWLNDFAETIDPYLEKEIN